MNYYFPPSEFEPIGNSDWISEYHMVELDNDGKQIDLSGDVDCDYKDCTHVALYYYRHQCCRMVSLACEVHKNMVMRTLISMQERGEIIKCTFCKTAKIPLTLITRPQLLRLDTPPAL